MNKHLRNQKGRSKARSPDPQTPERPHEEIARLSSQLAILRRGLGHNLTNATGFTRMTADQAFDDARQRGQRSIRPKYVRLMVQGIDWVTRVVDQATSDSAVLDPANRLIIHSTTTVQSAIAHHPAIAAGNARVRIAGEQAWVRANPFLYQCCIHALLENAVKYVPKGTRPIIEFSGKIIGRKFRLSVTDNGVGLTETQQLCLFNEGQRFHRHLGIPGKGHGLAFVCSVAKKMGGTVGVHSKPGSGSTFWMQFPCSA